ncbi:hypothetical protein FB107DRAFT_280871 [Schizophyllum commune]
MRPSRRGLLTKPVTSARRAVLQPDRAAALIVSALLRRSPSPALLEFLVATAFVFTHSAMLIALARSLAPRSWRYHVLQNTAVTCPFV